MKLFESKRKLKRGKHEHHSSAEDAAPSYSAADTARRCQPRRKGLALLKKQNAEAEALNFAENHHHVSKRTKRRRRLAISAGTGVLAVTLALTFVLAGPPEYPQRRLTASAVQAAATPEAVKTLLRPIETVSPAQTAAPTQTPPTESTVISQETAVTSEEPVVQTQEPEQEEPKREPETKHKEKPSATPKSEPKETEKPKATPKAPQVKVEACLAFYEVKADQYDSDYHFDSNYYEYTEDEKYMLAQIIDIEAGGEEADGMIAVGNVVMNRVLNSHKFGNTIKDVITEKDQFGYNGREDRSPGSEAKRAASAVLDREVWVVPQNVYSFKSNVEPGAAWRDHIYYKRIGEHNFYSDNFSGRSNKDQIPNALYNRTYRHAQYGCKPEKRVKRIQIMLNGLGFKVGTDGYFGKDTYKALKLFQETHGLEADGVAGAATMEALIKEYGLEKYCEEFSVE